MRRYSIVRRLIGAILLVELCSGLVVVGLAFVHERHERFITFDVMLRGRADSLLGAVQQAGDEADTVMLDGTERSLPRGDVYVVMAEGGRELGRSTNWSDEDARGALGRGVSAKARPWSSGGAYFPLQVGSRRFGAIRIEGVRMVDPGEKGGGIPRRVTIVYGAPVGLVWHGVWEAVAFYGWVSAGVMVLTGLLMAWVLHRGLRPLRALAEEASGVSVEAWEFRPSQDVMATRELAPLAAALGSVLVGLKESFEQRDRFVSDAAHELKTSVAVVKSSLQLLTMRQRTVAEYANGLERTEADCARMEAIVGKMLLLARLEDRAAPGIENAEESDVVGVLRGVVEELGPLAEARGVRLVLGDGEVKVRAGVEDLRLLCENLVENAIQHSEVGGEVTLSVERRERMARLEVVDRGCGIAAEDMPHVFERFYRGDPSRSRATGGTGLGLAICRAIVSGLGGAVTLESEVGKGTRAIVLLP
jgi:signal transduction histidine kinase